MPPGYGVEQATEILDWEFVESKLRDSRHYWLATVGGEANVPHVVPRWGVWLNGAFWYDGSPETKHVRNLVGNPACALHLEDGAAATIVYGNSEACAPVVGDFGTELSDEFGRKYGPEYTPAPDAWSDEIAGGLRRVRPYTVIAWTGFPKDMTRFSFDRPAQ